MYVCARVCVETGEFEGYRDCVGIEEIEESVSEGDRVRNYIGRP